MVPKVKTSVKFDGDVTLYVVKSKNLADAMTRAALIAAATEGKEMYVSHEKTRKNKKHLIIVEVY